MRVFWCVVESDEELREALSRVSLAESLRMSVFDVMDLVIFFAVNVAALWSLIWVALIFVEVSLAVNDAEL